MKGHGTGSGADHADGARKRNSVSRVKWRAGGAENIHQTQLAGQSEARMSKSMIAPRYVP